MEFYSKQEFNEMQKNLIKQLKAANKKIAVLEAKVKELKKDYEVLLETATEA